MSDFVKEIHNMFDHIWDCEIDHPVFQDTVGELMEAVIQTYEKHKPTLSTNLASLGTDCISRQAAISAICNACGKIDCDKMDKCEKLQLPPANCSEFPNNSDTISRQAAIDYFVLNVGFHDEDGYPIEDTDELRKIWTEYFSGIPSAEPQIIRCKDCKNWDTTWTNDFSPNYHYCPMVDGVRKEDWFCADAERRTE